MASMIPIFYYHSVGGPPPQSLPADVFRRHLQSLRDNRFTCVTVSDLVRGGAHHERTAVLTFDDGLLDNYTVVFPLLLEFGFRATFYVVPRYAEITRWVHPRSGRWSDVTLPGYTVPFSSMQPRHWRELAAQGMEIGSHTLSHQPLTRLSFERMCREVVESRQRLQDEIGAAVQAFCYPLGRFNGRILRTVEEAGYAAACTTLPGYFRGRGAFALPRLLVENPLFFEEVLRGRAFHPLAWPVTWARWRKRQSQTMRTANPKWSEGGGRPLEPSSTTSADSTLPAPSAPFTHT